MSFVVFIFTFLSIWTGVYVWKVDSAVLFKPEYIRSNQTAAIARMKRMQEPPSAVNEQDSGR